MIDRRLPHDWFSAPLPANVTVGARSWVYSAFAFVHCRSRRLTAVRVGRDTGVYHGCFFELGPGGEVEIGDYCALVGAIVATDRRVVIGDGCFLAHEVVLADGPAAAPWPAPPEGAGGSAGEPGERPVSIELGANVWIGARAILLGGARVGEGAIVGAAAVVDGSVPAYAVVAGNPARVVGEARPRGNPWGGP